MPLPRFRIQTLMLAVVFLAICLWSLNLHRLASDYRAKAAIFRNTLQQVNEDATTLRAKSTDPSSAAFLRAVRLSERRQEF